MGQDHDDDNVSLMAWMTLMASRVTTSMMTLLLGILKNRANRSMMMLGTMRRKKIGRWQTKMTRTAVVSSPYLAYSTSRPGPQNRLQDAASEAHNIGKSNTFMPKAMLPNLSHAMQNLRAHLEIGLSGVGLVHASERMPF
jgi:hypothetical protein